MKRSEGEDDEKRDEQLIELKVRSSLYKRPYGLLSQAGIATDGMTPREAWGAVNELRRAEAAAKRAEKEAKKQPKAEKKAVRAAPKPVPNKKTEEKRTTAAMAAVPELSERNREIANSNSQFDRGNNTVASYKAYAAEINSWDIPKSKKEKLIADLHKRYEEKLSLDARYVPWTVSGPARYPAQKMNAIADRAMKASHDIVTWFDGIRESVKKSKDIGDDFKKKARKEEETLHLMMRQFPNMSAATVGNWLAPIAQYDPKRYKELYEAYDKKYHFRKNSTAAKLYDGILNGTYKGIKPPKKLYESDSYNAYRKNIQSGERVFLKFTTKPKPQMIYALKKRGWHWNALENAWSVPVGKYDADFVKGIEENYEKYL